MKIFNNLHAFLWQSMTVNNCNTYLIDGPSRVLIDPGHGDIIAGTEQVQKNFNEIKQFYFAYI